MQLYIGPVEQGVGIYPRIEIIHAGAEALPYGGQLKYKYIFFFVEDSEQTEPSDQLIDYVTAKTREDSEKIAMKRANTWWPTMKNGESYTESLVKE